MSNPTVEIVRYDTLDTVMSLGLMVDLPAIGFCAMEDGRPVATFGLAWGEGQCWLWFKVETLQTRHRLTVWRQTERMKRLARQLGERSLYVVRDRQWPSSQKLVKLMGFVLVGEVDGQEIHRCELYGDIHV